MTPERALWPGELRTAGIAALALPGGVRSGLRCMELPYGRIIKVRPLATVEDFADSLSRWAGLASAGGAQCWVESVCVWGGGEEAAWLCWIAEGGTP